MLKTITATALFTLGGLATQALAGPIDPPAGPVAPTQATVIDSLPYTIDQPGSYVLTGNLIVDQQLYTLSSQRAAIEVNASNVTIDMRGFSLIDTFDQPNIKGIFVGGDNVEVRDGTIADFEREGLQATGDATRVIGLRVMRSGQVGVAVRGSSYVSRCVSIENGVFGFAAGRGSIVENCIARGNGDAGINMSNQGVGEGFVVRDCVATANLDEGIRSGSGVTGGVITNCVATNNATFGIDGADALVVGNVAMGNGSTQITGANRTDVDNKTN